ncbi:MAG: hypothetical protein VXX23_00970, partial [Actinomycetota bacterium]|nr:hypothetical protein [Actinomycetota bacterium]
RVIGYHNLIHLKDAEFKVRESGRQRVLRDRVKNVHAFVIGQMVEPSWQASACDKGVTYNPYLSGDFYERKGGQRVTHADRVRLGVNRYIKDGKCINRANIMAGGTR